MVIDAQICQIASNAKSLERAGRRARGRGEPQRRHRQRHDAALAVSRGLAVKVSGHDGKLTVRARSRIHERPPVWDRISGDVEADPDTLATAGAAATFRVDMTAFDAGDWLRNRKLRKDFDLDGHPAATFELQALRDVQRDGAAFTATARACCGGAARRSR